MHSLYQYQVTNMSSSPYPPADVKEYLRKHELQQLMNNTINDLLRNTPEDPYAFIIGQLQTLAAPSVEIIDISAVEVISGETFPTLKLKATVRYLSKELNILLNQPLSILSEQNNLYDQDRHSGKGLNKSIIIIKEKLSPKIKGLKCQQQEDIDRELLKQLSGNGGQGVYSINSVSFGTVLLRSQVLSVPPYQLFGTLAQYKGEKNIRCMVNCLQGGKAIGSKCKVFKYLLVAKVVTDPSLLQNVLQAVRKAIVGGKGGEAALKYSPDGTFVCPLDTINDNLKIIQEAIASSGAKETLGIGLSWQADSLFAADTKKYESQNPKTPFDNDLFIDFHIKMLTDKPSICYIQDPLAISEKAAWKKLITKIRQTEATKHVKIGSRNGCLINLLEGDIKAAVSELSVEQNADSHPDLSPEDRQVNNATKFRLDCVQVRAFETKTVSDLLRAYRQLRRVGTEVILQDCSFETYDSTLIDLAYGLNCFSSLGSIAKFDRISKLNRMRELLDCKENNS